MRYLIIMAATLMAASASATDTAWTGTHTPLSVSRDGYYDWSGGYAGMTAGYGWMDGHFETAGYPPAQSELNGSSLGVFGGFNIALYQALILGVEGDVEYNFQDVTVSSTFGTFNGGVDLQGSARIRLGYALDRLLIYGSAGWSGAHLEANLTGVGEASGNFTGFTLGAGIDYAVTDVIFGRIDYRYTDYSSGNIIFGPASVNADLTQQTVKVGLGIKF